MNADEPMPDERLAEIESYLADDEHEYVAYQRPIVVELLAEVKRWRGLADRSVEDLSADDERDEIRQFREMLVVARERAQTAHDQTAELGGHVVQLRAELAEVREAHLLSEAQLVEVTLERAEWRKQAQAHETVAKILRADLAAASRRAETAERELADACDTNASLRDGSKKLRVELDRCAELNRKLANESADFRVERDQARDALAGLRGRLRAEYGYRYRGGSSDDPEEAGYDDEETARRIAAHGDTVMRRLRTDWEDVSNGLVD